MRALICAAIAVVFCVTPPTLARGQAPFPDSSAFVEVDGARLFIRSVGAGKPLLVVHGGPGMSHDYLAPQLIALLADGYRLIFYDQRASGRSSGVDQPSRLTMAQSVDDLERLRVALRLDKVTLLGHSFGGLLAMYYAVEHPDAVSQLLLIDNQRESARVAVVPHSRTRVELNRYAVVAVEDGSPWGTVLLRSGGRR